MLDRMGCGAGAVALATVVLALGGVAEAQIGVLVGTVDAASCMTRTLSCEDAAGAECPAGEACESFGLDRSVCVPPNSIFCCNTDVDCPTDSSGPGGATSCVDVDGLGRGLCLPDNDYCAPAGAPVPAHSILACHTVVASTVRQTYANGDCDRDGIRNAEDPAPCLAAMRIGVWVPSDSGPSCASGPVADLVCQEVGDACTLPDDRTAICTANERTGGRLICSTLPDLFCCGGFVDVQCPAGECVLPSDVGDGQGMCTHPRLLCSERPTMDELFACHSIRGILTTIENGDCDGDGIANAEETEEGRCVADVPSDGGVVTSDGGTSTSDAGPGIDGGSTSGDAGAPVDAGGTPIEPSFNGGGGCACRSAPGPSGSHGWLALVVLGLGIALRRR